VKGGRIVDGTWMKELNFLRSPFPMDRSLPQDFVKYVSKRYTRVTPKFRPGCDMIFADDVNFLSPSFGRDTYDMFWDTQKENAATKILTSFSA
jgi:hypothetical protein